MHGHTFVTEDDGIDACLDCGGRWAVWEADTGTSRQASNGEAPTRCPGLDGDKTYCNCTLCSCHGELAH